LRTVTRCLTPEATKTTVQAFISCRLDYCNALLYGIADDLRRRLQSVQNAAARLDAWSRRSDHITPVLRRLHWLPARRSIEFECIHIQVAEWFNTSLLVRWLSACLRCWPPSASLIWCLHLCGPVHSQASVTGPSKSLDPDSGTICRLHYVGPTRQPASSRNCWRLICLAETAAH